MTTRNGTFTIAFDTLCNGFEPVIDEDGRPVTYTTEAEAQAVIDDDPEFYVDCFVIPRDEIGHKTIWFPEGC